MGGRVAGGRSQWGWVVIVTGNPGVFQGYPYLYPRKPVPATKGRGFGGHSGVETPIGTDLRLTHASEGGGGMKRVETLCKNYLRPVREVGAV